MTFHTFIISNNDHAQISCKPDNLHLDNPQYTVYITWHSIRTSDLNWQVPACDLVPVLNVLMNSLMHCPVFLGWTPCLCMWIERNCEVKTPHRKDFKVILDYGYCIEVCFLGYVTMLWAGKPRNWFQPWQAQDIFFLFLLFSDQGFGRRWLYCISSCLQRLGINTELLVNSILKQVQKLFRSKSPPPE